MALTDVHIYWLSARAFSKLRPGTLRRDQSLQLPDISPDIIIAAGHRTHLSLWMLAKRYRAFSVVLMKPSLPRRLFNAVICPQHDGLADGPRILSTLGVINKLSPQPDTQTKTQHLMLIGGPSKHYHWDQQRLLSQINQLCLQSPEHSWQAFTSPRTPEAFSEALTRLGHKNLQLHDFNTDNCADITSSLLTSAETWVSPDSVSMIYEALSAGSLTRVFDLKVARPRKPSRVAQSIRHLIDHEWISSYSQWQQGLAHSTAPAPLQEADRAARWLLERYQQHCQQRHHPQHQPSFDNIDHHD